VELNNLTAKKWGPLSNIFLHGGMLRSGGVLYTVHVSCIINIDRLM
jgi:hypothetical protein